MTLAFKVVTQSMMSTHNSPTFTAVKRSAISELHNRVYRVGSKEAEAISQAYKGLHLLKSSAAQLDVDIVLLMEYLEVRNQLMIL